MVSCVNCGTEIKKGKERLCPTCSRSMISLWVGDYFCMACEKTLTEDGILSGHESDCPASVMCPCGMDQKQEGYRYCPKCVKRIRSEVRASVPVPKTAYFRKASAPRKDAYFEDEGEWDNFSPLATWENAVRCMEDNS